MLPNGWKRVPLHEVAEVRTGIAKGKTNLKDPVELPYLRVANVQDGHLNLEEVKTILVERHQVDRYSLRTGDILMTEGGDFDKLGRGDVWQGQIPLCLHQNHVFAVRPNPSRLDSAFLAALAASKHGRNYFLSCAKRSTNLASINASQLSKFPVLLPSLSEQKAIARVLGTWDAAAETLEQLIEKSVAQKTWLMRRLLVPSDSRRQKERWTRCQLGDLVSVDQASLPNNTDPNFTFRYISLASVNGGSIKDDLPFVTFGEAPSRARRVTTPGDILLSTVRPSLQGYARVEPQHAGCIASTGFSVLSAREGADQSYIFQYLYSDDIQRQISALVAGSNYPAISSTDVGALLLNVPPAELQQLIGNLLEAHDMEIQALSRQLRLLENEKWALMQQLLSGRRRVTSGACAEAEPA